MLKFEKFLEDVAVSVNSTSNIATTANPIGLKRRVDLPQIHKENNVEFYNDLYNNNIKLKTTYGKRENFKPTQKEFNYDKVGAIKSTLKDGNTLEPILVSKDNFIVDGHHRWLAHRSNTDQKVTKVDLEYEDLIKFIENKPYVYRKTIHESFDDISTQIKIISTTKIDNKEIAVGSLIKFKLPNDNVTLEFPDLEYPIYGIITEINDNVYTIGLKVIDYNNPFYTLIKIDINEIDITLAEV